LELFLDNDIILKLSSTGLLDKIEKIFSSSPSSIYVLPTAKPYISKNKKVLLKYGAVTVKEALDTISNYSVIPDSYIDQNKFIKLSQVEGIDSGEQVLYSLTPKSNIFFILTGDKISITALSNSLGINDIHKFLNNKILCLEQLLILLIKSKGFKVINEKITNANFCEDKILKICFNQINSNEKMILSCLNSYIKDLKDNACNLF